MPMNSSKRVTENSSITRVTPVFGWLERNADPAIWPYRLLQMASGFEVCVQNTGQLKSITVGKNGKGEVEVPASCQRLAWMIRNADQLAPSPKKGKEYRRLLDVRHHKGRDATLSALDAGQNPFRDKRLAELRLEGSTSADCLIDCETALIWIEGKRNDWLSPCIDWDVLRDQLARNVEAAWLLARCREPEVPFYFILCHERPLKHHERMLVEGYRQGTWSGGWLHLSQEERTNLAMRIGTLTWGEIVRAWPEMGNLADLRDVDKTIADTKES